MTLETINGKLPPIVKATNFEKIIKSVFKFFKEKNMNLKPYPSILFDCKKQKSLVHFCLGFYSPEKKEVHMFVKDRSPNDIVRTLFHELIHHWQNLNGSLEKNLKGVTEKNSDVGLHKGLTKIEREANDKGFCLYREWARIHKDVKNANEQFDAK